MGIKGIYKEIGPGHRQSLVNLAVTHLERTGRPLRVAIDISIWQFQVRAAQGGPNPAIRTIFYRLVRLLGHSIQPIFVFDGPNKPAFKRNKRSVGTGDASSKAIAKRLIRLFGFTAHDAPGEAEAECALLQREGIVDAVLSEDVDTIMFGCGLTLRSWSAESKGGTVPTHVTVYDAEKVKEASGLDREGMVLVALMSGGDYIPEGIPGCGVKVACEAARAGFGQSLCRIKRSDKAALEDWKADLSHQLKTNEKGFFRTKHKALGIPEDFPNMDVLRYYTHPVVSQQAAIDRLGRDFPAKTPVDVVSLREFVRDTFDWTYKTGAVKLIKLMAPSILVKSLLEASMEETSTPDDLDLIRTLESSLVKGINNKRAHFSTGGTPELRVSYMPIDLVPLDLDVEPEEVVEEYGRSGLATNSDDEFDEETAIDATQEGARTATKKKAFSPSQPDVAWIPESIVKLGTPLTVEDWEMAKRAKEAAAAAPKKSRKPATPRKKKSDMPAGALDKWVKVTKNATTSAPMGKDEDALLGTITPPLPELPMPSISQRTSAQASAPICLSSSPVKPTVPAKESLPPPQKIRRTTRKTVVKPTLPKTNTNPWTLAGSQVSSARVTKPITPTTPTNKKKAPSTYQEPILISSSPPPPVLPQHPPQSQPKDAPKSPARRSSSNYHSFSSSPPIQPISPRPEKHRHPSSPTLEVPRPAQTRRRPTRSTTEDKTQTPNKTLGCVSRATTAPAGKPSPPSQPDKQSFAFSSDEESDLSGISHAHHPTTKSRSQPAPATSAPWLVDDDDEEDISFPELSTLIYTAREAPANSPSPRPQSRAPQPAHDEDSWLDDEPRGKPKMKKLYIPRLSNVGFFKEVEYDADKREEVVRRNPGAIRLSDVSVVDLTGPDP